MKHLRVAILTHPDLVPPEDIDSLDDREFASMKTEWDVADTLTQMGHQVRFVGVHDDLLPLRRLVDEWQPHVVFNLLMEFQEVGFYQVHVASYLELLGVPFTGCNARGILLARDKALAKTIFRYHRVPTPSFAVFRRGRTVRPPRRLAYPLIVKAVDEEASLGISQASVVRGEDQLGERVAFVHERLGADAIAEEYIEGRELTISVIGNVRLETFPVWELFFKNLPRGAVAIATQRVKWDPEYQERVGIDSGPARGVPAGLPEQIAHLARRIYRTFGFSGYARMDLRLREDGRLFVIEANATPDVCADEDFALAARAGGLSYEALLQRILNLGLRYRPPWRRPT
jgi:D-alanine-D-alanine ligase